LPEKIFDVTFTVQKYVACFLLAFFLLALCLESCVSHDFPDYVCEETYTFSADIKPIIQTKCAISGCHNGDMGPDLNWTNFEQFHKRVESGLVKYRVTNHIMPPAESPAGPLSEEQIDAIACWSDQGALNN
jgi:hypothetical protein